MIRHVFTALYAVLYYWNGLILLRGKFIWPELPVIIIIFASTLLTYYYLSTQKNNPAILLLSGMVILVCLPLVSLAEMLFLGHLGGLTLLYNSKFMLIRLRLLPFLKIFLVAYIWVSLGVVFPAIQHKTMPAPESVLSELILLIGLCLLFDLKEVEKDRSSGLQTIATVCGVRLTRFIGFICLLIFGLVRFLPAYGLWPFMIFMTIGAIITIFTSSRRANWYFPVIVDGILGIYFLLTLYETCFSVG